MLILGRAKDEDIHIYDEKTGTLVLTIKAVEVSGGRVRLGFDDHGTGLRIIRKEIDDDPTNRIRRPKSQSANLESGRRN